MEYDLKNVNAKANAGMATGITALGIEALGLLNNGGLGGLLGGNRTADNGMAAILGAALANSGNANCCNEDHNVNRYEAAQAARIAELETEVKLRDANIYTDQKSLALYQYIDGQLKDIRNELCRQAVVNQQTADSFRLVEKDLQRERDERCCGDNAIINYANATFYPKMVADVTTGTTTTAQSLYNPLPNCGWCK